MKLKIHELFSSRGMTRVLCCLLLYGEVNITRLTKETKLNHKQVRKYVNRLIKLGIAEEKQFGNVKIIRCKPENKYVKLLMSFVREWEKLSS